MSQLDTSVLFKPFSLGKLSLPNRIVMAPMTRMHSPGHVPNAENAAYYRRRTEGGVGLIVTEGTLVDHPAASGYHDVPIFYGDAALEGWKQVVTQVHAAGGLMIPQLWHCGSIRRTGFEPFPETKPIAPSAITHPLYADGAKGEQPAAMTQQDIDAVIAGFARSAAHARDLGFDGVEIHGAHAYLIDQFFWERTNQRSDRYGGARLAERMQFAVELVSAVRDALGPDLPLVFRFSQWKQGDYEHKMAADPIELERFLTPLCDAGVDLFHASTRRFNDPEFPGSELNLAGWCKKITGKPAITVGSVGLASDFISSYAGQATETAGIEALIRRMEAEEFDLVALGRGLLADPEWANKLRDGRADQIIPFERKHMQEYF